MTILNTNNLHRVAWFQVFSSNINNSVLSITFVCPQLYNFIYRNTNNFQTNLFVP